MRNCIERLHRGYSYRNSKSLLPEEHVDRNDQCGEREAMQDGSCLAPSSNRNCYMAPHLIYVGHAVHSFHLSGDFRSGGMARCLRSGLYNRF